MAEPREDREGGLPVGVIAAVTFAVGVLFLYLLFRSGTAGDVVPPLDAGFDAPAFEERVAARLDPVTVRPAGAMRVRVGRVVWRDAAGRAFLEIPTAVFAMDFGGPGGGVVLRGGVLTRPEARLIRSADGRWNYEPRLDPLLGRDRRGDYDGGGGFGLALVDFTIRDGTVTIDLPETSFAARSIDLRLASAEISGPGVSAPEFRIASAGAALELPDTAGGVVTRQLALENALLRVDDGVVAFDIRRGTFGSSTFADAAGIWDPAFGGLGLDATVVAEDVRLADIPWLRAEVPTDAAGSFRLRIAPRAGDRTELTMTALSLSGPGSSATGSLTAVFGPGGFSLEAVDLRVDPLALSLVEAFAGPLPYAGELRGTLIGTGGDIRFDLTATVATSPAASPFDTDLTGMISFTPQGIELGTVIATLDRLPLSALAAIAPGLPFAGPLSGTVTLDGLPSAEPIRLDVRLEAGGGIILVAGVLDLTGVVPAYDLSGTLAGVELRRVFEPAMPPAQVHAAFELAGSGTELATADARVRLNGTFTGWRAEPGDTVALVATTAGGRLNAQAARLELGPVSLVAVGEWDMVGEGGGAIRYALAVSSLEPLAPYLPPDAAGRTRFSRGSLSAEGSVSGTLDAPVVAGEVDAREFRFGEWAAERLQGEYSARFTGALPVLEAEVSGTQLRTPAGDYERLEITADFTRPAFELSVDATQLGGGVFRVQADGLIEDTGGREIQLRTAEVDLEDQRWRLPVPARIAWTAGDAVRVEDFRLEQTGGPGRLRLDGIVTPFDDADFDLAITSMPIGDVLDVVGSNAALTGDLTLDGRVRGPSDAPSLDLRVGLADGSIRDVAVRSLDALIAYQGTSLTIEGVGALSDSAGIELTGTLPARFTLGLPPTLELIEGGAIEARLATEAFPLQTLEPGIRSVRDLEGLLSADVRLSGSVGAPQLAGGASLVAGALTVPLLDKSYTGIEGSAVLEGRTLRVTRLIAQSGGTATVEGVITFDELTNPTLDLSTRLEGFEPQGVANADDAAATGTLRLTGSVRAPVLSGRVTLDDGTLSIAPFSGGPTFGDRLVGIAESFDQIATGELDIPGSGVAAVRITNLRVTAGPDLWFATDEARARLRGMLDLETVGNDITIVGTLTGEQGTFNLRAGPVTRRFDVVSARIRFLGSPDPNPGLDITASRIVPTPEGGVIDVRARVTGTLNDPQLSLSSADGIAVAESELLSLVLFGRPTFTAGEVAGPWQENFIPSVFAFAGVFDVGSEWLGQIDVIENLDQFQIQMRAGSGGFERSNLWVIIGEQIGDEVFVSFESPLDASDLFVLAAEWRIDRQWTVEASWEPESYFGATGTGAIPLREITDIDRQYLIVIRRRWTY
ncbi:MAG TPA: translocation/assembly module TamB domain-containing protein [Longimicrobiales bacterium]|nr:translocation/assembly module TamB domain-containing protein [Longimicrobiales bacterium]